MDIQIIIAGSAGEGIQTIGNLTAEIIQSQGYLGRPLPPQQWVPDGRFPQDRWKAPL